MPDPGAELYVERPQAAGRSLCRGVVTASTAGEITVGFRDASLRVEVGSAVAACYMHDSLFSRQAARVLAVRDLSAAPGSELATEITLELLGSPVPNEQRETRRVSVRDRGITVDFDDEIGCRVVDLNADGLSVLASGRHVPGAVVDVALWFDRERFTGRGAVKSASGARGGVCRYGIHVLATRGSTLSASMPRIHAELHGDQLPQSAV